MVKIEHSILFLFCLFLSGTVCTAQNFKLRLLSAPSYNYDQFIDQPLVIDLPANWRISDLKANELEILRRLSPNQFIICTKASKTIATLAANQQIWLPSPDWKCNPAFQHSALHEQVECLVIDDRIDWQFWEQLQLNHPIKYTHLRDNLFLISGKTAHIRQLLLPRKSIQYIGIEARHAKTESRVLDMNLTINQISSIQGVYPEYDGSTINISVKEHQFDTTDLDLKGKFLASPLGSEITNQHATEMATIIAGAGNSSSFGKGVAPQAKLASSSLFNLMADPFNLFEDIYVQNHSYGTAIQNFYGVYAESYDLLSQQRPSLLHVFSAGNSGLAIDSITFDKKVEGYYNITGNLKMAKNILTVGALDSLGQPMFFSSRGPAYDGRVKPEIVAYSQFGTSNSAALVSGTIGILQQAFKEKYQRPAPAALVRGVLINTAKDVGSPGIDFATGYGSLQALDALKSLLEGNFIEDSIQHTDTKTYSLEVPANTAEIKMTLSWLDPPAKRNSAIALVNDLDLELISPDGTITKPWILNTTPDATLLAAQPTRGKDELNNQELITLLTPAAGLYTIRVNGYDVSSEAQAFYINYQIKAQNNFSWYFPVQNDNIPFNGESDTDFLWSSTYEEPIGRLEYSIDNGKTWITISESVDLSSGRFRWKAPDIFASAIARMQVGNQTFPTAPFVISRPLTKGVGFNCETSSLISWNKQSEALQYETYNFQGSTLMPVAISTDTFFVFEQIEWPSQLFSVAPVLPSGETGIRSPVIDVENQAVGCYALSFFAFPKGDEGVSLSLFLGTRFNIQDIIFERFSGGVFTPIGNVFVDSLNVNFLDENPMQGLNTYRAQIRLTDGSVIPTEIGEAYFFIEPPFQIFPNPNIDRRLNIFSNPGDNLGFTIELYDAMGRQVQKNKITSDRATIFLRTLSPGLYFYRVEKEEEQFEGKIVVK